MNPLRPHRKRLRFLFIAGLALLMIAIVWLRAKSTARHRIAAELGGLDLGRVTIGNVSLLTTGVTASNVGFFREDNDDAPWMTLGKLVIAQPLGAMIAGSDDYDRIEIRDAKVQLEVSDQGSPFQLQAIDLAKLELPADLVLLTNATIAIRQPNHQPLIVENVSAKLSHQSFDGEQSINVFGQIDSFWQTDWHLQGTITPRENKADMQVRPTVFTLPENWTQLPGLPTELKKYFDATGRASIEANLTRQNNGQWDFLATLVPQSMSVKVPAFDLGFQLLDGQAVLHNDSVEFQQVVATSNRRDRLKADATLAIGESPVELQFVAIAEQISVSTLRKLVREIPPQVRGVANATSQGRVQITETLDTTLQLTAEAKSVTAAYGSIQADSSTTNVIIESLILDRHSKIQRIAGDVSVEATVSDQPVHEILETFELQALQRQLDLDVNGDGQVNLKIPLATADRLETWDLDIGAQADAGTIRGNPITDVRLQSRLNNGTLQFEHITAVVAAPTGTTELPAGRLTVEVNWPIAQNGPPADMGTVVVKNESLPVPWLFDLAAEQLDKLNSAQTEAAGDKKFTLERPSELTGAINATARIQIDPTSPHDPSAWIVHADFSDSTIGLGDEELRSISGRVELVKGILTVDELTGHVVPEGKITGNAQINVVERDTIAASLRADDLPFVWLCHLATRYSPTMKKWMADAGWVADSGELDIDGRITVEGTLRASGQQVTSQQTTQPPRTGSLIEFASSAKRVRIKSETFENLQCDGIIQDGKVTVTKAKVRTQSGGLLAGNGLWMIAEQQGAGEVEWSDVQIRSLVALLHGDARRVEGVTNGNLSFRSAPVDSQPVDISGTISAIGLRYQDLGKSDFRFEMKTTDSVLYVRGFHPNKNPSRIELNSAVALSAPHNFRFQAALNELQLSDLDAYSTTLDREATEDTLAEEDNGPRLSGSATGEIKVAGTFSPFAWTSQGALQVSKPAVGSQSLSDVSAEWSLDNRNWNRARARLGVLGGKVELVETVSNPNRMRFSIVDVKARELSALAGPDFPVLAGSLQGEASVNQWDLIDKTWADLNLTGASTVLANTNVTDLGAEVDYRNRTLTYSVKGRTLAGSIIGQGSLTVPADGLAEVRIPLDWKLDSAKLNRLALESNRYRKLQPLGGDVSAQFQMNFDLPNGPAGSGRFQLNDLSWRSHFITRLVTTDIRVANGRAELDNLRADLRQGEISGRARIPFGNEQMGTYQLDIRQLNLGRIMEILLKDPIAAKGQMNARISGQVGRNSITGRGTVGVQRASMIGLTSDSLRVPLQFQYDTTNQSGGVKTRGSELRLLDGRVTGQAAVVFGNRTNIDVDLKLSKVDTGKLFAALKSVSTAGQGDLSGRLVVQGRGVRSHRDLQGRFIGELKRAEAFRLPVLQEIGVFLGGRQFRDQDFDSDKIDLLLSNGRVDVRRLNFTSSLMQIAFDGFVYLDGRLDLSVAARVNQLNQPTLLEELAGSPLATYTGTPVGFFAQAAEFLSNRIAFLSIGGTLAKPLIRLDSNRQIREETIRYFLRGSQILPTTNGPHH